MPERSRPFQERRLALRNAERRRLGLPLLPPLSSLPVPYSRTGVQLGIDRVTGRPAELSPQARRQGTYIVGGTGSGKSTLLENIIADDMARGFGVCVLDPHGDLVERVLLRVPAHREEHVVILNPADVAYPFAMNIYHCPAVGDQLAAKRTVDGAMHVYEKLWGPGGLKTEGWGANMEQILRACAITLSATPGATMLELPALLIDDEFRQRVVAQLPNAQVRWWWTNVYDRWDERQRLQQINSTLNKVTAFTWDPTIEHIIGQAASTVDFRKFMEEGTIVLVPLSAGLLGAETAVLLGATIVAAILSAALSRQDTPPDQRRPFHLFADEVQHFTSADFAQLLVEARKYAIAMTAAHQYREQLDARSRQAMLNVANLVTFRVSGVDAAELAGEYDTTPPSGEPVLQMVTQPTGGGLRVPVKDVRYELTWDGEQRVEDTLYQWKEGPTRTYLDMEGERKNELATLQPYYARVRLRQGNRLVEHVIETDASPLEWGIPEAALARGARIIERSRKDYGRPRDDVVEEIARRWEQAGLTLMSAEAPTAPDTTPRGQPRGPRRSGRSAPAPPGGAPQPTAPWEPLEDE